jgi:hypothetical protein
VPVSVDLMEGTISELNVMDENKNEVEFGIIGENQQVIIFPTKNNSIVRYNLENIFLQKDGMNSINIKYEQLVSIITPKDVNLVFVNEIAILLDGEKGINCHGCDITLHYFENDERILQKIYWEDEEFYIEIYTDSEINDFNFSQQSKSVNFNIEDKNKFIAILLPLELLWDPYQIFLDDKKIKFQKTPISETHVLLNMKPETSGTVSIIGTTVIPEFPIIAPLAIGFLMILIIPFMKKINLH